MARKCHDKNVPDDDNGDNGGDGDSDDDYDDNDGGNIGGGSGDNGGGGGSDRKVMTSTPHPGTHTQGMDPVELSAIPRIERVTPGPSQPHAR